MLPPPAPLAAHCRPRRPLSPLHPPRPPVPHQMRTGNRQNRLPPSQAGGRGGWWGLCARRRCMRHACSGRPAAFLYCPPPSAPSGRACRPCNWLPGISRLRRWRLRVALTTTAARVAACAPSAALLPGFARCRVSARPLASSVRCASSAAVAVLFSAVAPPAWSAGRSLPPAGAADRHPGRFGLGLVYQVCSSTEGR